MAQLTSIHTARVHTHNPPPVRQLVPDRRLWQTKAEHGLQQLLQAPSNVAVMRRRCGCDPAGRRGASTAAAQARTQLAGTR
eukprot:59598-Chlamydomonas_euryale.AAC.1